MPRPSHRLDLYVVPDAPDRGVEVEALQRLGETRGWWTAEGRAGSNARALVQGGFARARALSWPAPRFLSNQQGGFAVRCPHCHAPVVPAFTAAMTRVRAGEAGVRLTCPTCGRASDLPDLDFAPPAAFASGGLQLVDVAWHSPEADALTALSACLGALKVVGTRVSA